MDAATRPLRMPDAEALHDKLLRAGAAALSETEVLALALAAGSRCPGQADLRRAGELLAEFRSVRGLLSAGTERLLRHPALGRGRCARLFAALELARRHHLEVLRLGPPLTSPHVARDYLVAELRDRDHEVFCCLFLDSRHRLIAFEELFRGTIDGASVHPREVVKQALARHASAVILAHNHPSGIAEPSQADELITLRLRDALALVDVRVLDHLIVGDGGCTSLAERGVL